MECYLDNSATTKPCKAAVDAEISALTELYGNPSSLHQKGVDAYMLLEKSRGTIAASLKASPDEIYFTPCGTVSNNTAIFGAVGAKKRLGKKIVTTALEHPSVEKCMERLEESGFEVVRVQPQSDGNISLKDFENAIDENTILVSVMAVNNEVGSVMPAEKLKKIIKSKNSPALLHVDDVQGYMKIPLCPKSCGIDLMSVSAHKVHGPKGVGALYINKNVRINPYILGGGQENNMCSGTQGMPAIAGFAAAVENGGSVEKNLKYVIKLNLRLRERIKEIPGVHINSPENALPYIINISIDEIPSQVSVNFFSMNGVYISAGSACSKGHRSNVLQSMGLPPDRIDSAIRISLSNDTSIDEIDRCADVIKIAVEKLRKHKG